MFKRLTVIVAGVLLVAGGVLVQQQWRTSRLDDCKERSAELEALEILDRQPGDILPDQPTAGCDVERMIAYAGRHFVGAFDEQSVVAFYRQAAVEGAWRVAAQAPPPGENAARLCASKEMEEDTVYMNLSFPYAGAYEVFVANSRDAGARCSSQGNG